jgi:hypothetical protein
VKNDFFSMLTQEIRDEVMERYVTERRLIELQTESLNEQVVEVRSCAAETAKRMTRLGFWMIQREMREELAKALNVPENSPWSQYLEEGFSYQLHSVQVSALRDRIKLRKILIKAYQRAYSWMLRYTKTYEDFKAECEAVNTNIKSFQKNFDLRNVLSFLKGLDTVATARAHILGGNFTPEELCSVDEKLRFHTLSIDAFDVPPPLPLPEPNSMEDILSEFAGRIYAYHENEIKHLIEILGRKGY